MNLQPDAPSRFGHVMLAGIEQADHPKEFKRLWRGFMTARTTLGLGLLLLQGVTYALGAHQNITLLLICAGYFAAALTMRLVANPRRLGKTLDIQWISTIGVDILTFTALQVIQGNSINYAPLLALPVLMASVLGSLLLAMGAAASVTLLFFAYATWMLIQTGGDAAAHFLQAALTGAGCFAIAFLANQVAIRLAKVELRAQRSQLAAREQRLVNELVIESLTDGVLVLDQGGTVRAANPAAHRLLGARHAPEFQSFDLTSLIEWQDLVDLMRRSFSGPGAQQADITIHPAGQGPRRVRVRTQMTDASGGDTGRLCVMFLQDQREMEARMRTEKLASMGRMSAAVAHEIRNPLAAIAQANALLDEDLCDPKHRQLTQIVRHNARRLGKIVDEVLDIARLQHHENTPVTSALALNTVTQEICRDWQEQTASAHRLNVTLSPHPVDIRFEAEHLRRILVNLLDNARRYASPEPDAVQVIVDTSPPEPISLRVWSNGQPLDQSIERHLFEPFFSSESRSSGLGLYICRELCEKHGASIAYYRTRRNIQDTSVEGNEFIVTFQTDPSPNGSNTANATTPAPPWLPTPR
jgi:two-component system sensor histidine kinase PilS (NtrC family)